MTSPRPLLLQAEQSGSPCPGLWLQKCNFTVNGQHIPKPSALWGQPSVYIQIQQPESSPSLPPTLALEKTDLCNHFLHQPLNKRKAGASWIHSADFQINTTSADS